MQSTATPQHQQTPTTNFDNIMTTLSALDHCRAIGVDVRQKGKEFIAARTQFELYILCDYANRDEFHKTMSRFLTRVLSPDPDSVPTVAVAVPTVAVAVPTVAVAVPTVVFPAPDSGPTASPTASPTADPTAPDSGPTSSTTASPTASPTADPTAPDSGPTSSTTASTTASTWCSIAEEGVPGWTHNPVPIITAPVVSVARVAPVVITKPPAYNPNPDRTATKTCEAWFIGKCPRERCFFLHEADVDRNPIKWTFNTHGQSAGYWTAKTSAKWRHWHDVKVDKWYLEHHDGSKWRTSNPDAYFYNIENNGSL